MGSGTASHQICTVDEENDLGIMFSRNFKFKSNIYKMVQKANKVLEVINRTFKYLDPNIMRLLYTSLVRPHLDYHIEGNIGGLQLWRIHYKNMFDEINFGEFEAPVKYNGDSFRDT